MTKLERTAYNAGFSEGYNRALEHKLAPKSISCVTYNKVVYKTLLKRVARVKGNALYKRSVFVDASGRQFNGKQCPDCKYSSTKGRVNV